MERNKNNYKNAIKNLAIDNADKYRAKNGQTFCNFFVQDLMKKPEINAPLPAGTCEIILKQLHGNNFKPWASVNFIEAQERANLGIPTIGITDDHIVVVTPNENKVKLLRDIMVSQAGNSVFFAKTIDYSYKLDRLNEIKFYSYFG